MTTDVLKKNMKEKKGLNWPLAIVIFFSVVFVMNAYLIYTAYTNFDGLVDDNYYQKGLFYDANRNAAEQIGWGFELKFKDTLATNRDISFVLNLSDKTGAPLKGATVAATLRRLATDKYDDLHMLTETEAGYTGVMSIPMAGTWEVYIEAEKDGLRLTKRIKLEI